MNYVSTLPIKLGIIIRSEIIRKGIIRLIADSSNSHKFKIIIDSKDYADISKYTSGLSNLPDIIIVSVKEYLLISIIRKSYPKAKVLLIGIDEVERELNYMFQLEIEGGLFYDSSVQELYRAIETIYTEGYYYSNELAGIMAQKLKGEQTSLTRTPINSIWISLTSTEREFVKLACSDLTYYEIASKLKLSPKTIDKYRATVFEKFAIRSRVGLAIFAIKYNLVKI
jgi:two-component system, NarL family, invasion response regulator UvrY